ncbi:MAG: flagellar biosynthetic protein FliR [Desulfobacterales bacterium]|nr:flagellar biosynthetic protein FliR [Desulfobacterales bacterium]
MDILNFSPDQFKIFLLVLTRVSIVLFLFPVFSTTVFPNTAKAAFCLVIAFLLFPVVSVSPHLFPENMVQFMILMVSELILGMILGLTVHLFFGAAQLAGAMIGFQMGFRMINVVDPQTGMQVSILEQVAYWVALLVFLLLNGHHAMISALADSFHIINIGFISFSDNLVTKMLLLPADMFTLSIKIGAPAIAALIFTSAAFGITAKFLPQMNILIVGFPVKIAVGLLFFGLSLQALMILTRQFVSNFSPLLHSLMVWMSGG